MCRSTEKKIIIISLLVTILICIFINIHGNETIFSSEKMYITKTEKQKTSKLTKEDYELIETKNENHNRIYRILLKNDLNNYKLEQLYKLFKSKYDGNLEIHLVNNSEDNEPTIKISQKNNNSISIKRFYTLDIKNNEKPKEYNILSIKTIGFETFIECELPGVDNEVDALKYIRYIGNSSRKSSKYNLNINAYDDDSKKNIWKYDGNYKNMIVKENIISMN